MAGGAGWCTDADPPAGGDGLGFGTPPGLAGDPWVSAAARVSAQLLAPAAQRVDRAGVPAGHVATLAGHGLLGLAGPREWGGGEASPAVVREVGELLAGGCLSTWFVAAQHVTPMLMLARSGNVDLHRRWLRPLCTGRSLAAVGFSHLRRSGPAQLVATPTGAGWRFDGSVSWLTSWGLAEVVLLAAESGREVVWALLPAQRGPAMSASGPLPLAVMGGTHTVRLAVQGLAVGPADVVAVGGKEEWARADRWHTANVGPAVFGVLRTALRLLRDAGLGRGEPEAVRLAGRWAGEAARVRSAAYRLIDEVPSGERLAERTALRAQAHELAVRATGALVTATAGPAMSLDHPAQRLAREALFLLVQAQTAPVRRALLERFAG